MSPIFLIVLLAGWLAQFVDGTLGMGFGAFSATFLVSAGLYPAVVSASIHTAKIGTNLICGGSHLKFGNVEKTLLTPLVICGVPCGVAGAYLLSSIPGKLAAPYVAAILLILGVLVVYRFTGRKRAGNNPGNNSNDNPKKRSFKKTGVIASFAAFIDAIGGGGWGPVATPGLILQGSDPRKVIGSVNLAEFFIALAISVTFIVTLGLEMFRWDIVTGLLIGGAVAAPIAAYLCKKLPHQLLGVLLGIAIVAFNLRVLILMLT